MKNVVFIVLKDCVNIEALPIYGNRYWKTPNIDELASNGTVFYRHYTAGPSTAMSVSAMLSGHYLFDFKSRKEYVGAMANEFPSLYDYFQDKGYETHLIWDGAWIDYCWRFVKLWGDENITKVHNLDIAQPVGSHKKGKGDLVRDNDKLNNALKQIYDTINKIDFTKKQFVILHLPHVIKGRICYMDDVDVWDEIVGFVRRKVGDDSIYLTSDHGHMNLYKGKVGYGFDVYEPAIRIPLITPRLENVPNWDKITCNIDLGTMILEHTIPQHDYVISETQYYGQPDRKTAIVAQQYKYIYNKATKKEELYDLSWDPLENHNILESIIYEKDRKRYSIIDEMYFYPYKEEALKEFERLRQVRLNFWRDAGWYEEHKLKLKKIIKNTKLYYKNVIKSKI